MYNNGSSSLKYFKTLKIYKNSTDTVSFNPETLEGRSYRWTFCYPLKGTKTVIFNTYKWSHTTSCHQNAVRSILRTLEIKVIELDLGTIDLRELELGFSGNTNIEDKKRSLFKEIQSLKIDLEMKKKKDSYVFRYLSHDLDKKEKALSFLESITRPLSQKDLKHLTSLVIEEKLNELNKRESERVFKALCKQDMIEDSQESIDLSVL